MAVPGRAPKDGALNRNTPMVEWTEIPNRPNRRKPPVSLPESRRVITADGPIEVPLSPLTLDWWKRACALPHAALWAPAEWMQVLATAMLADALFSDGKTQVATELRRREDAMGFTEEARRKLRIRYIDVPTKSQKAKSVPVPELAPVTPIDPRRERALNK